MSAPTKKTAPGKAAVKRSPRAAAKPAVEPELTDEDLTALADDQPEAELAPGEIRPVIIGKRGRRGDAAVQMVTLFELDDVPYQIPRNPSAALVLRWILDVQGLGEKGAVMNMAVMLLGQEALDGLARNPEVEPEDIADIFTNIGTVFFSSENYRKVMAAPDPS